MASRVTLGHSGRPLEADSTTWCLFWLVQAAALVRMLPACCPCPGAWRPRVDGKPG
jgi:uncharacterized protein involved in response to NO